MLTAVTIVAASLILMFTSPSDIGDYRDEALFGVVEFTVTEQDNGAFNVSVGLAEPLGVLPIFGFWLLTIGAFIMLFRAVKARRTVVLEEMGKKGHLDDLYK